MPALSGVYLTETLSKDRTGRFLIVSGLYNLVSMMRRTEAELAKLQSELLALFEIIKKKPALPGMQSSSKASQSSVTNLDPASDLAFELKLNGYEVVDWTATGWVCEPDFPPSDPN